jgi:uncharacterized protein (TIGR02246 family)
VPDNLTAMADHAAVSRWVAGYEAAWRAAGTGALAGLFTEDASYLQFPYARPVTGLDAIGQMWDAQRDGPDEVFTLASEIIAVDGPAAVVRAEVRYGDPVSRDGATSGSSGLPTMAAAPGSRSGRSRRRVPKRRVYQRSWATPS